jgi:signal transduction histidine kinase/uncharacterized protein HemY
MFNWFFTHFLNLTQVLQAYLLLMISSCIRTGKQVSALVFFLLFIPLAGFSFSIDTDSLENSLLHLSGTDKVDVLNLLSRIHQWKAPEKSKVFARQAYYLASSLQYKKGISYALWKLGSVYEMQGDYHKALDLFLESSHIQADEDNKIPKAHAYSSIGNLYTNLQQYDKAYQYLSQALSLFIQDKDSLGEAISYRRIGFLCLKQDKVADALTYFKRSLYMVQKLQDKPGIAYALSYIGQVQDKQEHYKQALEYYKQAIQLQDQVGNDAEKAYLLIYVGDIYSHTGEYTKAIESFNQALSLGEILESKLIVQEAYKNLSELYKKTENFKEAYTFFQKYTAIQDSIFSKENMENLADLQIKYETYEKEQEIELLKKEREIQRLKINKNNYLFYFCIIILVLFAIVCGLFYNRYRLKQKANLALQQQNEAIHIQKSRVEESNMELAEAKIVIEIQNQMLKSDKIELEGKVKERNTELMSAYSDLLRISEEMDTLVYKASHDLRGPLATIMGICNIALMEVKDQKALSYFSMLATSSNRMDKLLHRLLKVNHIKHTDLECSLIDIEPMVTETLSTLQWVEGYADLKFFMNIETGMRFFTDASLLKVILENLIENTINYRNLEPESSPYVWITMEKQADAVIICVKDNGMGIAAEHSPKIFNMFYRGTERTRGSGLGLYIAHIAVQKMHGNIRYCNEITDETVFEVILPSLEKKFTNVSERFALSHKH